MKIAARLRVTFLAACIVAIVLVAGCKDDKGSTSSGSSGSTSNTVTIKNLINISGATTPIDIYIDGVYRDGNVGYGKTSSAMTVTDGTHNISVYNTEGGGVAGYWWNSFTVSGGATLNCYVYADGINQY